MIPPVKGSILKKFVENLSDNVYNNSNIVEEISRYLYLQSAQSTAVRIRRKVRKSYV